MIAANENDSIAYPGRIDNIQASWPKIGLEGVTQQGQDDFAAAFASLDRQLRQRNTRYDLIDELVDA